MATKSSKNSNSNRSRSSDSKNNNPEGHNQYSGWMDTAKDRPVAAAAAAAAAVGAGVFLWSRRNQISEQISSLSDQVSTWAEGAMSNMNSDSAHFSGSSSDRMGSGSMSSRTGATSTGSSSSHPDGMGGSHSNRGSSAMDDIAVIEVDTVTL